MLNRLIALYGIVTRTASLQMVTFDEVKAEPRSEPVVSGPVFVETRAEAPREFYIKKEDADKFGYTRGAEDAAAGIEG